MPVLNALRLSQHLASLCEQLAAMTYDDIDAAVRDAIVRHRGDDELLKHAADAAEKVVYWRMMLRRTLTEATPRG
jgi:hypothetical protein